jgi:hypothetical protein
LKVNPVQRAFSGNIPQIALNPDDMLQTYSQILFFLSKDMTQISSVVLTASPLIPS